MSETRQTLGTERFKRPTTETSARRAATMCANPDCMALTSGPADIETAAINVGEACLDGHPLH